MQLWCERVKEKSLTMEYPAKSTAAPQGPAVRRYGLALLFVGTAFAVSYAFLYFQLPLPFTALALCAIAVTFWYGGVHTGILAAVLSAVLRFFFFERGQPALFRLVYDLVFLVFAILMTKATRARDELEARVAERTAALTDANESLRAEVDERRKAEEKLRRSEAYLAEAQKLTHTGSWALDGNSKTVIHWSEETYRIFGFDIHAGVPPRDKFWERIHPDDRRRAHEVFERAVRELRDFTDEFRIVVPRKGIRHIHVSGHLVRGADGELIEIFGTHVDITDHKRAEEEHEKLHRLEADVARISRITTMGELTASLAHELNQPIAAALMDANTCVSWLTRERPDREEACEAASRVVTAASRAVEIIKRIRSMFTKETPDRTMMDVNEVIREMICLLRDELTRYSISVETTLAKDLPPIIGDRVQVQQVMMNLIVNSIEAMKDIDGTRQLAINSSPGEKNEILVVISDTGVGLPQDPEKIFDAFFTTKVQGTGMGLRISRSIIESHGGRLWASAHSARGASFYVKLPLQQQPRT